MNKNRLFPCLYYIEACVAGKEVLHMKSIYEKLEATARSLTKKLTKEKQAVALLSKNGRIYSAVQNISAGEEEIELVLSELQENKDTAVLSVICMFDSGDVDLPSYAFRKVLLRLNAMNKNTGIYLKGQSGYIEKRLKDTMR